MPPGFDRPVECIARSLETDDDRSRAVVVRLRVPPGRILGDESTRASGGRIAVEIGLNASIAGSGSDTLDVLGRLVDKSLVVAEPTPRATRYRLLDTVRSYAWEWLVEAGEVELAAGRHVDHFLGRAEDLYVPTESVDGPTRDLDEDLDDLRRALAWCERTNPAAGLRLIAATVHTWWRRSCAEGRQWPLSLPDRCPSPSLARCRALYAAGRLEVLANPRARDDSSWIRARWRSR
jgi:hypothetical protein